MTILLIPKTFNLSLSMDVRSSNAPESGQCEACSRFFILEASLTKHRRHCSAAHERSRRLWKNGASNIKKLNASLTRTVSLKREHEEVHEDYRVQDDIHHVSVLVRVLLPGYSGLDHTFL